jgi:hypothetical protein
LGITLGSGIFLNIIGWRFFYWAFFILSCITSTLNCTTYSFFCKFLLEFRGGMAYLVAFISIGKQQSKETKGWDSAKNQRITTFLTNIYLLLLHQNVTFL